MQCLWPLFQDERHGQTAHQTQELTSEHLEARGNILCKLFYPADQSVAENSGRRNGVQCLRPVSQATQGSQADDDEEGDHPDQEQEDEQEAHCQERDNGGGLDQR